MKAMLRNVLLVEDMAALPDALSSGADALLLGRKFDAGDLHIDRQLTEITAEIGTAPPLVFIEVPEDDAIWPELPAEMKGRLAGIVLASASLPSLDRAAARLAVIEAEFGLEDGALQILVRLEDARSILALSALSRNTHRLAGLVFDEGRLRAVLGPLFAAEPIATARGLALLAASALGVPALAGAEQCASDDELRAAVMRDKHAGFSAKLARSRQQLGVIRAVFA